MLHQRFTLILLLFPLLVASNHGFGQSEVSPPNSGPCGGNSVDDASGSWTLSTDADVAALAATTPSIPFWMDCLRITGSVSSVSALSALNLNHVDKLFIDNTTSLRNLEGLETVGDIGDLEIYGNAELESLSALKNVGFIHEYADVTPGSLCESLRFPFLLYPEVPIFDDRTLDVDGNKPPLSAITDTDAGPYGGLALFAVNKSCWNNAQAPESQTVAAIKEIFDGALPVQKRNPDSIGDSRERFTVGKGNVQVAAMSVIPECKFTDISIKDTEYGNGLRTGLLEIDFELHDCSNYFRPGFPIPVVVIYDFGEDLPAGTVAGKLKADQFTALKQGIVVGPYLVYMLWDDFDPWRGGCEGGCSVVDELDEDLRVGYIRDPLLLVLPTTGADLRSIPTLSLFGLFALGGLVGLFGLRKLKQ